MRELLMDLGFEQCTGYDIETWVYDQVFWVEFADDEAVTFYSFAGFDATGERRRITDRRMLLENFIRAVKQTAMHGAQAYED